MVCSAVNVGYGQKSILSGISFSAQASQITVILGKNGCGKSTLFKAITGNLPYQGSIRINDCEVAELGCRERAKIISFMPQSLASPDVSVRDLVSFGRQPYTGISGILTRRDRDKVEQVMADTGILRLADRRVSCVSGGERQKAYFAMMLAQETPVLLLDEPASHLDAEYTKRLSDFLRLASRAGKTVLVVLHDINHALEIADQILVLGSGNLIFRGSTADFTDSRYPETIFGLHRYECPTSPQSGKQKKIIFL